MRQTAGSPGRIVLTMVLCIWSAALMRAGTQHDDGIVGMTRKNGTGCACHNLTATPGIQVRISGPAMMRAGSASLYTVTVAGGPAVTGGFNVATRLGSLLPNSGGVQLMSGELAHTAPKAFSGDSVQWTFSYVAPAATGSDTIYAVGQSTNGNLLPDNGDQWNFSNNFVVTVVPASAPVPSLTEWGIVLLLLGFLVGGREVLRRLAAARAM